MARIHRWSVMIYGSLQAEFMETKYNSHIHRYGTSVFGQIVINTSKSINNNNQIFFNDIFTARGNRYGCPVLWKHHQWKCHYQPKKTPEAMEQIKCICIIHGIYSKLHKSNGIENNFFEYQLDICCMCDHIKTTLHVKSIILPPCGKSGLLKTCHGRIYRF